MKNNNLLKAMMVASVSLSALFTTHSTLAAEALTDCSLRDVPFSSSLPAYDVVMRPKAKAIVDQYYPGVLAAMPAWILNESMPSFSTLITLDQLLERAGVKDDDNAAAMRKALAELPVTREDKIARCARFDAEPVSFELGDEPIQVLIYQKINGYDHGDSVTTATANLTKLAKEMGYGVSVSAKGSAFTSENLADFDLVIWNNVSGDTLTVSQREAFEDYMNNGGGFLGIHASGGDSVYFWDWYRDVLIGAQFIGHPLGDNWFQDASLDVTHHDTGVADGIPSRWVLNDEWYSFSDSVSAKGYDIVMSIDESTYTPGKELEMGKDHPLVWTHCIGAGRAMYSAIGHRKEVYNAEHNITLLKNGMKWASGQGNDTCQ
ncbi:ThuA domain-containing protein [Aestuariibacter sp. GS-14]|uniref:ThuA domain-containing protein n=1 Tax=Aestuariibacter sp. GS-14 TaxID=2590670 RepID=UPI001129545F|nr:ThuA domain-containing protein [Aestuariibacter sp. GS-14]TPV53667.1 ThuA domain-containing protein [Aestuariibacter sp. GS-14]